MAIKVIYFQNPVGKLGNQQTGQVQNTETGQYSTQMMHISTACFNDLQSLRSLCSK